MEKEIERLAERAQKEGNLALASILYGVMGTMNVNDTAMKLLATVVAKFSKDMIDEINWNK